MLIAERLIWCRRCVEDWMKCRVDFDAVARNKYSKKKKDFDQTELYRKVKVQEWKVVSVYAIDALYVHNMVIYIRWNGGRKRDKILDTNVDGSGLSVSRIVKLLPGTDFLNLRIHREQTSLDNWRWSLWKTDGRVCQCALFRKFRNSFQDAHNTSF